MKVSLEWLREWCEWEGTATQVADQFTRSGTEVISMRSTGSQVPGVITAKILEKKPHPNADRLTVCQVDDGSGPRQVVCGAKNHNVGDIVPLAKPGTTFPDGLTIKSAKLRGESSEGMLCSAKELGIAEGAEGLLLLPKETPLGVPLEKLFPGETVLEFEVTPNRADLASMEGVAREFTALGAKRKDRGPIQAPAAGPLTGWRVEVADPEDCPRYSLTVLSVKAGLDSPDWMKKRLAACGMRSLGLLVDVTNYVLLEIGQPTHVFDAAKIQGTTIQIRRAKAGEKISGLDGGSHEVNPQDLVIADGKGPVALAGVVGGKESSVEAGTRKILLESARFHPGTVRKTARRLSLHTESSRRFGRGGLDPALVERARNRVISLLQECGALEKMEGTLTVGTEVNKDPAPISLRVAKVEKMIGHPLDAKKIQSRLTALGFEVKGEGWIPPSWRGDVREEMDLIEELIRLENLDQTPSVLDPLAEGESVEDREDRRRRRIRAFLTERGYTETMTGSLIRKDEGTFVKLSIPAGPEASALRGSLLPGLLGSAGRNVSRGMADLKLFEIGRVAGDKGREEFRLALLVAGRERPVDWQDQEEKTGWFSLKGVLEELRSRFPGIPAEMKLREAGAAEKKQASLKIPVWVAEVSLGSATAKLAENREISSFPGVERDLALVLPETIAYGEVEKAIRTVAPPELESLTVFDRFRDPAGAKVPKGSLSLGCRLKFRSPTLTLTEEMVNGWEKKILESLSARCQAKLRGVL
ncbi:phenylalanine--tRNA ligase subunit beta [bacterium]|nr:phenylalanine--tRNA ligase subunit beta [bacterium]